MKKKSAPILPVILLLLLGILAWSTSCRVAPKTEPVDQLFHQKRVLFLGNSITQNGLYVSCIEYLLKKKYPDIELDIISIGLSSETVSCLTENDHPYPRPCLLDRLDRALAEVRPELTISCYGMNDGIYHPPNAAHEAAFQKGIRELRAKVKAAGSDLIIITPPPFDPLPIEAKVVDKDAPDFGYSRPYRNYDDVLGQYSRWLMGQAGADLTVVDWHSAINEQLENHRKTDPGFSFAGDGIHPSPAGHLLMATTFLEGLGFKPPEDLPIDWETVSKDPLFQRAHQQRSRRSALWLPYVGYTREEKVSALTPKPLLILMGGQSNMVGSGKQAELPGAPFPKNITFIDFGLHANSRNDTTRFGPEIGLSEVLAREYPHQSFILLKYAVGGSSLLDWAPEYSSEKAVITGNAHFGNMYEDFFRKIDSIQAVYQPEVTALLWMQGEQDARFPEAGKDYYDNFKGFITAFRNRIDAPQLPVIFGVVNPPDPYYPARETVVEAQRKIAAEMASVDLVETAGLEKWSDNLHYNTQGQLELGREFGEKLLPYLIADEKKN